MSAKTNRTGWPAGAWDDEPEDRIEWRSEGLLCLMLRNGSGAWCGYVGILPGHPWHGVGYDDCRVLPDGDEWPDVHGGLTYSGRIGYEHGDDAWWVGFDCSHAGDVAPAHLKFSAALRNLFESERADVYRDIAYVRAEVEHLAVQARCGS